MDTSADTVWIFAGSVIAAFIVLFSGWLQQHISRASTISDYRQKWIQDIRHAFLNYLEQLDKLANKGASLKESNEMIESYSEIIELINPVRHQRFAFILYLNPRESEHKKLVGCMDDVENYLLHNKPQELKLNEYECKRNKLINEFQENLKEEWDRIKQGDFFWKISRNLRKWGLFFKP